MGRKRGRDGVGGAQKETEGNSVEKERQRKKSRREREREGDKVGRREIKREKDRIRLRRENKAETELVMHRNVAKGAWRGSEIPDHRKPRPSHTKVDRARNPEQMSGQV